METIAIVITVAIGLLVGGGLHYWYRNMQGGLSFIQSLVAGVVGAINGALVMYVIGMLGFSLVAISLNALLGAIFAVLASNLVNSLWLKILAFLAMINKPTH